MLKSESSAGDETLWWNWQFTVTRGESSRPKAQKHRMLSPRAKLLQMP